MVIKIGELGVLYHTILADPPWKETGGGKIHRGADRHYSLMKTDDIMKLEIPSDKNSHLYLWVTNSHLEDGLAVLKSWGFRYITMITWAKDRFGLGQYFRGQTEHVLFGVKGNLPYKSRSCSTLILAKRRLHSQKPDELYALIETVSYPPYLEMFARQRRLGWDVWGREAPIE